MKWHYISGTQLLLLTNTEKQHVVSASGLLATDHSDGQLEPELQPCLLHFTHFGASGGLQLAGQRSRGPGFLAGFAGDCVHSTNRFQSFEPLSLIPGHQLPLF